MEWERTRGDIMDLIVLRISTSSRSTIGAFYIDGKFESYTIEDTYRETKIAGETRIPSGIYPLEFKRILTPLTEKYRKKYNFFTWHLEIKNVPNYQNIYIHVGNTPDNSEGCILLNDVAYNNQHKKDVCGESRNAFIRAYKKISEVLDKGNTVGINIIDSDKVF